MRPSFFNLANVAFRKPADSLLRESAVGQIDNPTGDFQLRNIR